MAIILWFTNYMKRASRIWSIPCTELQVILDTSDSLKETLNRIGIRNGGSNYTQLNRRVTRDSLDLTKLQANRRNALQCRTTYIVQPRKRSLEGILIESSNYNRYHLKKRLLDQQLLVNRCCECGIGPEWQGKPLCLTLDHINGKNSDNRLENLRLLCPNCHSQTDTFSGKNQQHSRRTCNDCSKKISNGATRCISCYSKLKHMNTKIVWPEIEELTAIVRMTSFSATARELGVSGNAIRNRILRHGIDPKSIRM